MPEDLLNLLLKVKNSEKIKEAFEIIGKEHSLNHTSQLPILKEYLDFIKASEKQKELIIELIELEQKLFWTIDDTVDYSYSLSKKRKLMDYYNEVVKFVSFIFFMDKVLDYQLNHKLDIFNVVFNKKIFAERFIDLIYQDLTDLISIPERELLFEKKFSEAGNEGLVDLIIENQLNRTQNIKIYLATIEAVIKEKVPKDYFLFSRALQLIREDIEDMDFDKQRGSNNIIRLLIEKLNDEKRVKEFVLKAVSELKYKALQELNGLKFEFMHKIIENEEKKILEFLNI